jgi:hypothetical protein
VARTFGLLPRNGPALLVGFPAESRYTTPDPSMSAVGHQRKSPGAANNSCCGKKATKVPGTSSTSRVLNPADHEVICSYVYTLAPRRVQTLIWRFALAKRSVIDVGQEALSFFDDAHAQDPGQA